MERRKLSREFKLEAVSLGRERGGTFAQAARDLDGHENELRRWVRELGKDPKHAFPGLGQMKPEQQAPHIRQVKLLLIVGYRTTNAATCARNKSSTTPHYVSSLAGLSRRLA